MTSILHFLRRHVEALRPFGVLLHISALSLLGLGCSSTRVEFVKISMQDQVRHDFARLVEPASEDFCVNVRHSFLILQQDVGDAKEAFAAAMEKLAEDDDGYWKRKDGKDAFEAKLRANCERHLQEPSQLALRKFFEAYATHVHELEARLLLRTGFTDRLSQEQQGALEQLNRSARNPAAAPKQGNVGVKLLDDALGFVPLVGDGYDIFKAFVYDKRLEEVKAAAKGYGLEVGNRCERALVLSLEPNLPKPKGVEADCRRAFSVAKAMQLIADPTSKRP